MKLDVSFFVDNYDEAIDFIQRKSASIHTTSNSPSRKDGNTLIAMLVVSKSDPKGCPRNRQMPILIIIFKATKVTHIRYYLIRV
jgi:hypothetical protein